MTRLDDKRRIARLENENGRLRAALVELYVATRPIERAIAVRERDRYHYSDDEQDFFAATGGAHVALEQVGALDEVKRLKARYEAQTYEDAVRERNRTHG